MVRREFGAQRHQPTDYRGLRLRERHQHQPPADGNHEDGGTGEGGRPEGATAEHQSEGGDYGALQQVFSEETAESFQLDTYDYIIDAIDSLKDKATLILLACQQHAKLFSSMGAALKLDPTRIKVTEFWKVKGDPLARALRNRFKKDKTFPKRKFLCIYSDELLKNQMPVDPEDRGNGSIVHITAIFGLMLAGLVIQDITNQKQ